MANYSNTAQEEVPLPPAYKTSTSYARPTSIEHEVHEPPSAYSSKISYGPLSNQEDDPDMYDPTKDSKREPYLVEMEVEPLRSNHAEGTRSKSLLPAYMLVLLSKSRYYIRAVAVMVMVLSMTLILIGVGKFSKAKNNRHFEEIPKPGAITDQPCIVFTGIAAMNLVLSAAVLLTSCLLSKFRKSSNVISAVFTIISAIGFSSSMGACFFLNRKTTLQNDLWKWSCANERAGITSPALNFGTVCNVIAYSWRFGLLQASLELLTFIISCTTFFLGRTFSLSHYGIS